MSIHRWPIGPFIISTVLLHITAAWADDSRSNELPEDAIVDHALEQFEPPTKQMINDATTLLLTT